MERKTGNGLWMAALAACPIWYASLGAVYHLHRTSVDYQGVRYYVAQTEELTAVDCPIPGGRKTMHDEENDGDLDVVVEAFGTFWMRAPPKVERREPTEDEQVVYDEIQKRLGEKREHQNE